MGDHSLTGSDVKRALLVLTAQHSLQHNRELVKGWRLAGLDPSTRTAHVGYAGRRRLRIHAPNVFVDELGLVACGLDTCGCRDESVHIQCPATHLPGAGIKFTTGNWPAGHSLQNQNGTQTD